MFTRLQLSALTLCVWRVSTIPFSFSISNMASILGYDVQQTDQLSPMRFLKQSSVAMVILMLAFAFVEQTGIQLVLIFFIGLCADGMFPIALTASALMIENAIDEATSYFIAAASLGGASLSFLIDFSLEWSGATAAILVFSLHAILLVATALQINHTQKKKAVSDVPSSEKID
ncbi:hypothetical protein [Bacillus sp. NPDC077027]|uniref:hypothetical protein n=1 Tax=Bacillus sp. NPDC077027 TaxID=3390548 RepID=UPI003CFF7849